MLLQLITQFMLRWKGYTVVLFTLWCDWISCEIRSYGKLGSSNMWDCLIAMKYTENMTLSILMLLAGITITF